MKIFILEKNASIFVNDALFESLIEWLPFLNDLIDPLIDKKLQLACDATHKVDKEEDFLTFHRYLTAGQLLLAALLIIAERTFKINNQGHEAINLKSGDLLKTDAMQDYLLNGRFKDDFKSDVFIEPIVNVLTAKEEMLKLAERLSFESLEPNILKNVKQVLDGKDIKDILAKAEILTESLEQNLNNDSFIHVYINEDGRNIYIYFNGNEEQYSLIDKWLNIEELKLEIKGDVYQAVDTTHFLSWYNKLKLRFENECSYQTLMNYLGLLEPTDAQSYRERIEAKIKSIYEAVGISDDDKRKQIIAFCQGILNARKNAVKKAFQPFNEQQLIGSYLKEKDLYLLNLYN